MNSLQDNSLELALSTLFDLVRHVPFLDNVSG